jgi:hypothetical protein
MIEMLILFPRLSRLLGVLVGLILVGLILALLLKSESSESDRRPINGFSTNLPQHVLLTLPTVRTFDTAASGIFAG